VEDLVEELQQRLNLKLSSFTKSLYFNDFEIPFRVCRDTIGRLFITHFEIDKIVAIKLGR
jgi:hypothetical protein